MPRVRVGALELAYETDGEGDPLLLLMGLGGEHHGWDLLRPELVRRHRLVLLDNRDAGVSDEATGPYGIADMAADALGVMDQLGIERFHLLGASMGGAIAQQVALQAPYRVAAMVLVATWARTDGFLRAIFGGWRRLAERVPAEELLAAMLVTAEVMLVPGSGHACFLETPRAVAERALRFLARHPIRTG